MENETEIKKENNKLFAWALILIPILIWIIDAIRLGFHQNWFGSQWTDITWGIVGIIIVMIGVLKLRRGKNE